jgi:hypothetical protein
MPKPPRPWTVTPHGPLVPVDENLWTIDSPVPGIPGGVFPRKMSIVRRSDGTLLFHNAIPVDDPTLEQVRALGKPALLVVPSPFHCIDAHAFRERLGLQVYCPAAAKEQVTEVVAVDGDWTALPADSAVRVEPLDGTTRGEGALAITSAGHVSLLFCDAFFNLPHQPGFWGLVWRLGGFSGPPMCGPVWLKRAVFDRSALAASLDRLAALPSVIRLVPSHGEVLTNDPAAALRSVAAKLRK